MIDIAELAIERHRVDDLPTLAPQCACTEEVGRVGFSQRAELRVVRSAHDISDPVDRSDERGHDGPEQEAADGRSAQCGFQPQARGRANDDEEGQAGIVESARRSAVEFSW